MHSRNGRIGFGAAVVGAFVGGLVFAAGFDLTPFSHAQQTTRQPAKPAVTPALKTLEETGNAFVNIAESVTPAVVSIHAARDVRVASNRAPQRGRRPDGSGGLEDFFQQFERNQQPTEGSGTGFIVSPDGYILTNNHVVADFDRVDVTLTDHRVFKATVVGRDPQTDVAVIKIDGKNLPTAAIGNDDKVRIGEWVVAIGNPLGLDFTVTAGIVSAKGRGGQELRGLITDSYAITDFIQTDAAINPGNSGGPLVNIRGEVIGINSAIASGTGYYQGYGFAIPITLAKEVMDDLIAHGRVRRAILGVSIVDVSQEDAAVAGLQSISGVKVQSYSDDSSPSKKAGLEPGDVIVSVDGRPAERTSTLQRIIRSYEPGQTVTLEAMRYGSRKTFKVRLAEAKADSSLASAREPEAERTVPVPSSDARLGIAVEPLTPEFARQNRIPATRQGVRVADVERSGVSSGKLFENDIITDVLHPGPRRAVTSVAELQAVLKSLKSGEIVSLYVFNPLPPQTPRVVNIKMP
jgi:serine protease Do